MSSPAADGDWLKTSPRFVRWYVRGTVYTAFTKISETAIALFLTPFLLLRLESHVYGLWALVLSTTAYLSLTDAHMATPLTKYAAEPPEKTPMAQLLTTSLLVTAAGGALIFLATVFLTGPFLNFFTVDPSLRSAAAWALLACTASFVIGQMEGIVLSVLVGRMRGEVFHQVHIPFALLGAAAAAATVGFGGGLKGLAVSYVATILLETITLAWVVFKMFPDCRPRAWRIDWGLLNNLARFGGKLLVGKLGFLAAYHFDKLLLGRFAGMTAVAHYDLGHKIGFAAQRLCLLPVNAVVPAASDFHSRGEDAKVRGLFDWANRVLFSAACLLLGWVVLTAPQLIQLWVGGEHATATAFTRILAVGYLAGLFGKVAGFVAVGIGKPELDMRHGLVTAVANVAASTALFFAWGPLGAAVGTSLALAAGALYYIGAFHRVSSFPQRDFWTAALIPLGAAGAAGTTVAFGLTRAFDTAGAPLASLILKTGVFTLLYAAVLAAVGYIKRNDVESFWQYLWQPKAA